MLAALAGAWQGFGAEAGPAPRTAVRTWAADRNGCQVLGLDPDLHVVERLELRWPVGVEARADGGTWVLAAEGADPLGPHRLLRLGPTAAIASSIPIRPLWDLATLGGGPALVVELSLPERVLSIAADGGATEIALVPAARSVAAQGDRVLVGTTDGRLVLLDAGGAALATSAVGGLIGDVAPAPQGGWWALDIAFTGRLLRVHADLAPAWEAAVGLSSESLLPVPGEERVWIADASEPAARRFGPGGALELSVLGLPLGGFGRGAAEASGGVQLAAPGAILRLGPSGERLPGQGGFEFLVSLSRVPPY